MIINELITKLSFALDQRTIQKYENAMKQMQRQASAMASSISRITARMSRSLQMHVRIDGVEKAKSALKSISGSIDHLGKRLSSVALISAGSIAAFGAAAAGKLSKDVFDNAMTMETLRAGLVTSEGSEKGAKTQFARLSKFAEKFPSTIDEVIKSYIQLKNLNMDSSERAMIAYGNLAGATPGKRLKDVSAMMADASTFQFERIREFGMSYETGEDAVEFTFRGIKTKVNKNAADIQKYFISTIEKHFGGGMKRQAATIEGKMSNLSDAWMIAQDKMWEAGLKYSVHSFVERLTKAIKQYTPAMIKFGKAVDAWSERSAVWFHQMKGSLTMIKPYIEPVAMGIGMIAASMLAMKGIALASGMVTFFGMITSIGGAGLGIVSGVLGAISSFAAFAAGAGFAGVFAAIGTTLTGIVTMVLPAIGAFLAGGAIVAAIALIVALGVKLADYWARGDVALKGLYEKFPALAEGIKYIGDELAAWWPIIQSNLIGGFNAFWPVLDYTFNKILVPALGIGLKWLGILMKVIRVIATVALPPLTAAINGIGTAFQFIWDTFIGPILGLIGGGISDLTKAAGGLVDTLLNAAGINTGGSVGGAGGAGLASTAINFVKSGQADKYAFSMARANGFVTKSLFQQGIACAQTTDQLLKMAGASKAVQDAMTASAPDSYAALKNRGLATSVSEKDLKPGDLVFYNPGGKGIQHVGVYVGNGQVVDASNSSGKQIGTGQRVVMRNNWMSGNANYLRINDNQWMMPAGGGAAGGAGGTVNNITVDARGASNPELIKTKTKNGVTEALNKASGLGTGATSPKRSGQALAQ